jgi:drug/metabolite transporter (DMT)-like permease
MNLGVLFAFGALLGWAFGDFSIQRAVRAVGNVRALFYIGILGSVALLPFSWNGIVPAFRDVTNYPLIIFACALVLATALANFQGLKLGKLSVVMPINGLELVAAVGLAMLIAHERYTASTYASIILVVAGLMLTTVTSFRNIKLMRWEKGVAWAIVGAIGLGTSNFTLGLASRTFSPIFTVWLTHTAVAIGTAIIMFRRGSFACVRNDLKRHFSVITAQSLLDNLAWISYGYAAALIPIGIATTISEGYLVVATLLGVAVNKERLKKHQVLGIAITISGILVLSWVAA